MIVVGIDNIGVIAVLGLKRDRAFAMEWPCKRTAVAVAQAFKTATNAILA